MEQLVWAIIIIVFIIFTALKNRARSRLDTATDRNDNTDYKAREEPDKISRYMEELLGIEISEAKPKISRKREIPESLKRTAQPKLKAEEKIGQLESPLIKKYEQKTKSSFLKARTFAVQNFHGEHYRRRTYQVP